MALRAALDDSGPSASARALRAEVAQALAARSRPRTRPARSPSPTSSTPSRAARRWQASCAWPSSPNAGNRWRRSRPPGRATRRLMQDDAHGWLGAGSGGEVRGSVERGRGCGRLRALRGRVVVHSPSLAPVGGALAWLVQAADQTALQPRRARFGNPPPAATVAVPPRVTRAGGPRGLDPRPARAAAHARTPRARAKSTRRGPERRGLPARPGSAAPSPTLASGYAPGTPGGSKKARGSAQGPA